MLQSELDGKRVVVALGGNALGETPGEQLKLLENTSKNLAHMVKEGINVVVTHGNGPQVGIIDEAFEVASKDKDAQVPPMPLSDCNAMSQGYIGAQLSCTLRNEFRRQDIMREVANVPTHVVVDADDPAFKDYEKPIGAFMTKEEADKMVAERGYQVVEDAGRGYRRVVASPKPKAVVELDTIRALVDSDHIVVACGGGGIPVIPQEHALKGASAVIEKDCIAGKLAVDLKADQLIILTSVKQVYKDYQKETEAPIRRMNTAEAKAYIADGQFEAGTMLPKIEAAISYLEAVPTGSVLITSLDFVADAVKGKAGTVITS